MVRAVRRPFWKDIDIRTDGSYRTRLMVRRHDAYGDATDDPERYLAPDLSLPGVLSLRYGVVRMPQGRRSVYPSLLKIPHSNVYVVAYAIRNGRLPADYYGYLVRRVWPSKHVPRWEALDPDDPAAVEAIERQEANVVLKRLAS